MNNTTKKTLLEAENVALRTELAEAVNTIKLIDFDRQMLIAKDKIIDELEKKK